MPFKSKRQWRAAMAGYIPGISKEKAREWAHETHKPFKKLPDRAPAEKGKATLRTKEARMFGVLSRLGRMGVDTSVPGFETPKPVKDAIRDNVSSALGPLQSGNTVKSFADEAKKRKEREKKAEAALEKLFAKLAMGVVRLPSMRLTGVKSPAGAAATVVNPRRSLTQAITAGTNMRSR